MPGIRYPKTLPTEIASKAETDKYPKARNQPIKKDLDAPKAL